MAQAQLTAEVRRARGTTFVIDIKGEVNTFAEATLGAAYTAATEAGARAIVLNFAGLEYMNSSGIGLIVTLLIRANRAGQRFLSCGLSEHYRHVFELTRLSDAIAIHDTEADAVAATGV
jgi:anti-sigma B factor antagonist